MQLAEQLTHCSWHIGQSPMILSDIFLNDTSVTIWQRQPSDAIKQYFEHAFHSLGLGIRGAFSIKSLVQGLEESLPDYPGKQQTVEDIFLLSDMLTCLFDCDAVGLRLVPLTSAMCPRFHVDKIPVRLVNTYLGAGTQWLPLEALNDTPPDDKQPFSQTRMGQFYQNEQVQQMNAFDVGLLKGAAWEQHEHLAAVHRSCALEQNEKRVLLTLDPM